MHTPTCLYMLVNANFRSRTSQDRCRERNHAVGRLERPVRTHVAVHRRAEVAAVPGKKSGPATLLAPTWISGGAACGNHSTAGPFAFKPAEFRQRIARAQEKITAIGNSGLVAVLPESVTYLTGYYTRGYSSFQVAIIPSSGDPVIVCRDVEAYHLERSSPFRERAVFWSDGEDPVGVTASAYSMPNGVICGRRGGRVEPAWRDHHVPRLHDLSGRLLRIGRLQYAAADGQQPSHYRTQNCPARAPSVEQIHQHLPDCGRCAAVEFGPRSIPSRLSWARAIYDDPARPATRLGRLGRVPLEGVSLSAERGRVRLPVPPAPRRC